MTGLLLDPAALQRRATLVRGPAAPFAPLAASLAADLDAVLGAGVHVADRKARLTRAGGRCPVHGVEFAFDPFSPARFRCDACGAEYVGAEHHDFWLYRYQLWLVERAVHAAALHALVGRAEHAAFAARVLGEAAEVYLRLPNRDNVLGPGRPFFSTYLESLWLLALCVTLDLLESAGADVGALGGRVRDRLVAPSRALIASYPEGRSNRQVWNAAALLAAARLLGDARGAADAVHGRDGIAAALADGLLADGTWYEGDNYHQFAHRGLWFGLTMAARAGLAVDPVLAARFDRGFAAPFLVAMPGLTLPARRDAQFGVSLRQWRWAEWLELGLARRPAARADDASAPIGRADPLAGALGALYAPDPASGTATGRWRASGEAERNEPAAALTRADLGWKSLLFADPAAAAPAAGGPTHEAWAEPVLLAHQGLAILRGRGRGAYVSLDYGPPGGGHGHPDRLNLQVAPYLLDPGTGSYVERTLHWYRSTLAHAAPLVAERSQPPTAGHLLGFDVTSDPAVQAAGAEAEIAPGVTARRWLVLGPDYLIDRLAWRGLGDRTLDLPLGGRIHDVRAASLEADDRENPGDAAAADRRFHWAPVVRPGAGGLEDGFDFLADVEETRLRPDGVRVVVGARAVDDTIAGHAALLVHTGDGARLWRATAPGAPGHGPGPMCALRAAGDSGAIVVVWDLDGRVGGSRVDPDGTVTIRLADGGSDVHRPPDRSGGAWRVSRSGGEGASRELALAVGGRPSAASVPEAEGAGTPRPVSRAPVVALAERRPLAFDLAESHYCRSEASWAEAGRPTARITIQVDALHLRIGVAVHLGRPAVFVPPGTENPLDNERAGINGDGVQLHLGVVGVGGVEPVGAWLLVPVAPGTAVDVTPTTAPEPTAAAAAPVATWAAAPGGWSLDATVALAPLRARASALGVPPVLALAVLVNEMPPGRERRRGQLVLDGDGEGAPAFIYLRGDRHDPARGLRLRLPPAP